MKMRLRGNSIRLRLGEKEVAQLAKGGRVSDSIQFSESPPSALTYRVVTSSEEKGITARFAGSEITVTVPAASAKTWASSEQVGLNGVQPISNGTSLNILIEKDFRCLAPRPGEDESDSFANPAQGKECPPH
jgi:hypothetical protein